MQKLKTKEFWLALFMCALGILGIALMVKHFFDWAGFPPLSETDPDSIYKTRGEITRGSSAFYFTNITLFLFCVYAILNFVGVAFNIKKLNNFLKNPYVLLFIGINQFLVLLVYSLMAVFFGMGADAEYFSFAINRHDFAASLFKHYVLTIVAIVFVFLQRPRKRVSFKKCLLFLIYPTCYAIIIKICGMTCFPIEWYPYPFFSAKSLWFNLFHTLDNFDLTRAIFVVIGCLVAIAGIYILLIYLASLLYNKLADKEEKRGELAAKEKPAGQ